jgi:hypothetical protein
MLGIFTLPDPFQDSCHPGGRLQGGHRPDLIVRAKMRTCFASSFRDAQLLRELRLHELPRAFDYPTRAARELLTTTKSEKRVTYGITPKRNGADLVSGLNETLRVEQIPRERWARFFVGFSRSHEGWLVTVEVFEPSSGSEVTVRDQPLDGMTLDGDAIVVAVNTGVEKHYTHTVEAPRAVFVEVGAEGAERAVTIFSGTGRTTVRFRSSLPTEMVDGIV